MSKKKQTERQLFATTADSLMAEVDSGRWANHIPPLSSMPVGQWDVVLTEYENKCPGHTHEQYVDALHRAMFNNR